MEDFNPLREINYLNDQFYVISLNCKMSPNEALPIIKKANVNLSY